MVIITFLDFLWRSVNGKHLVLVDGALSTDIFWPILGYNLKRDSIHTLLHREGITGHVQTSHVNCTRCTM